MDNLFGESMAITRLARDASTLRHQAIASNIANVNTPGYVPLKVNFEEQLVALSNTDATTANVDLNNVKPFVEQEPDKSGLTPQVALDMEVVKLNMNTLHYQSLAKMASKYISIMSTAINEGKR